MISSTESVSVRFDPVEHRYWLGPRELPTVTQVLSDVGMLPEYDSPWFADGFYATRGTMVHKACALDLHGRLDDESLDDHVRPYVERFRRLIATIGPVEPLFIEQPLAHPVWNYAGTPDSAWRMPNGRIWIVDLKSGTYEPGHSTQLAGGYWPLLHAAAEEGAVPLTTADVSTAKLFVIPLVGDIPKPIDVDRAGQPELFRAALAVHNWRRANMKGAAK